MQIINFRKRKRLIFLLFLGFFDGDGGVKTQLAQ